MQSPELFSGATTGGVSTRSIRSATGADQQWFASSVPSTSAVDVDCALIERCTDGAIDASSALELTAGHRATLLWEIRRRSFGEVLDAVLECGSCHDKLDVSFAITELLGQPMSPGNGSTFERRIDGRKITFRLPTGRDQRAAATRKHPARELCRRCLVDIDGTRPGAIDDSLVDALVDALGDAIATVDPAVDTTMVTACPTCAAEIVGDIDAHAYLREELLAGADRLIVEIHVIALHYHWSERDILALPIERRRAYLELIANTGDSS